MTLRTEQVDVTETVQQDIPICDGCGREVDLDDTESTEWVPTQGDADPVHTCSICSLRSLAHTGGKAPLRARLRSARLGPENTVWAVFGLLMASLPGAIVISDIVGGGDSTEAFFIMSFVFGLIGLAAMDDATDGKPYEIILLVPLGGLVSLFAAPTPMVGWAVVVALPWLALAYMAYRCPSSTDD